jgi:hypothetical protein
VLSNSVAVCVVFGWFWREPFAKFLFTVLHLSRGCAAMGVCACVRECSVAVGCMRLRVMRCAEDVGQRRLGVSVCGTRDVCAQKVSDECHSGHARTEQNKKKGIDRLSDRSRLRLLTVYPPNVAACPDGLKHSV